MSIERARAINETAIAPALRLLPARMDAPAARIVLLAICGQESDFRYRRQIASARAFGPAKGLWQGELGGGLVHGVRRHAATRQYAAALYRARAVEPTNQAIWDAIEHDDVLAAGLARLLLWSDPRALPAAVDVDGGWQLYLRTWRPGAYARGTPAYRSRLRAKWDGYHATAREALEA
ncbi:hypothetical protein MNO14_05000 [Luteimonas sp. S4-F44]|uniref:hypothetical protein n=1 Tax=Luteimonas sp. S4-F44 TaxID=2925842 RepID=UPI001F53CA9C|nr:hypothetical protein [Luteimonas sp. S4-F44]UNK43444.1 hypothetical protein MNO14_05000 [Luteimonas sp. S4-F44]